MLARLGIWGKYKCNPPCSERCRRNNTWDRTNGHNSILTPYAFVFAVICLLYVLSLL
jgi:hypothetical protein